MSDEELMNTNFFAYAKRIREREKNESNPDSLKSHQIASNLHSNTE